MPCADCLLHQQPVTGRGLLSSTVAAMPSSCRPPPEACRGCRSPAPLTASWAQRSHRGSWTMRGDSPVQGPWWGLVCVRSVDWSRRLHMGRGKAWATGGPRSKCRPRSGGYEAADVEAAEHEGVRRWPLTDSTTGAPGHHALLPIARPATPQGLTAWVGGTGPSALCAPAGNKSYLLWWGGSATGMVGGCNSRFWRSRSAGLLVPYAVYKCSKQLHAFEFVSYLVHSLAGGGRDESYTTVTLFLVWLKSCFYQCSDLLEGSASSVLILAQLRFGQW